MLRPFILIGFLAGATGALAEPVLLTSDALKEAVAGSLVEIDTPLGTTVPMRFGTDGLVSAEAGVLAPVLGAPKDRGRWWVDGDKLCTKWFRWFDAQVRCLTIRQDGSRIYWRKIDDGETGTGTLVDWAGPKQPPVEIATADPAPRTSPAGPAATDTAAAPPLTVESLIEAAAPAPDRATVVARAETTSTPDRIQEAPAMHFGGAGLLEASSRVGSEVKVPAQAAEAKAAEPKTVSPPARAKGAAQDAGRDPASVARAGRKAAERHAALGAAPPARRAAQKPLPSGKDRGAVATSSTRSVALYRVTGVHRYDVLNVRRGPSEEHVSIASIPPSGRRVEIIGQCRADWCPIRYGAITGWVNSLYLAEEGARQNSSSQVYVARP